MYTWAVDCHSHKSCDLLLSSSAMVPFVVRGSFEAKWTSLRVGSPDLLAHQGHGPR
jgi:hypothetical protein